MALDRETVGLIFQLQADNKQLKEGLAEAKTEIAKLVGGMEQETSGQLRKIGNSGKETAAVIRESVESVSSEIIESFGVDGDIANVFGKQVAGFRAATLAAGGVVTALGAAVVGMVAFTLKQAEAAQKITLTSQALGISIEKLQLYQQAAEAAGVSSDAITGAFEKFREQTGRNANDFDALLQSLEAVERPADKLAIVHANLGEVSEDTAMAILAMTDNSGELRKAIEQSGAILSKFEAQELARVEQRFDVLGAKVGGFAKRTLLDLIDGFSEMGVMLGEGADGLDELAAKQAKAEAATRSATDAIQGQSGAVNQLSIALRNLDFAGIQRGIKDRVNAIVEQVSSVSKRALTAKEVAAIIKNQQSLDPAFAEALKRSQIFEANQKLFDDVLNPKESGGGRTRSPKKPGEIKEFSDAEAMRAFEKMQREQARIQLQADEITERAAAAHAARLEQIERIGQDRLIAAARAAAQERIITEEEAAIRIAEIQLSAIAAREDKLKEEMDSARVQMEAMKAVIEEKGASPAANKVQAENIAEFERLNDALAVLQAERTNIEEEANRRLEAARERDAENLRQYVADQIERADELRRIREEQLQGEGFSATAATAIAAMETLLNRPLSAMETLRAAFRAMAEDLKGQVPSFTAVFAQMKESIADALANTVAAFVAGKLSLRQAAAEMYKAALAPVKEFLMKKARFHFAMALSEFAMLNFAGGAKHLLAGGALAAAAGLIDAGGSLIAGSGAAAGAVAPGSIGGRSEDRGTRVIEQGDRRRPEPQIIIIRAETEPGVIVNRVIEDYKSNGPTRSVLRTDMLGASA